MSVNYNGKSVGDFRLDLIVDGLVIVETKAVRIFEKSFEDKLLNYLKTTKHEVGLIINFADKVYVKRKVNSIGNIPAKTSAQSAQSL